MQELRRTPRSEVRPHRQKKTILGSSTSLSVEVQRASADRERRIHRCQRLGRKLGLRKLYVKNEGENPTGSFKDRGMTVAISKAKELGKKKVLCASTGNTAASLAAYSARAGMECIVLVPKGKVAGGKMLQVTMHGAMIIQVKGDFDKAFATALELADRRRELYLMNSLTPTDSRDKKP